MVYKFIYLYQSKWMKKISESHRRIIFTTTVGAVGINIIVEKQCNANCSGKRKKKVMQFAVVPERSNYN
jgi:hypothetical protein